MPTLPEETLPRISIVMPTLNQADFIGAAVRSVMSQGVDDLELIVADGGSTDGTQRQLSALAQAFPQRLRWWSAPDGGPAQALNGAVQRARGELLGWLNSDDLCTAGAVGRALAQFARDPSQVMVYGHGEHINLFGASLGAYPTRGPGTPLDAFAQGCFICQPTVFMRRDTWLALGGLDETLRASFDFEFWLRLFKAHPGRIGFVDAVQAQSRLHGGGITLSQRERVAMEGLTVLRRHFGLAPVEWLLTHVAERAAEHPFQPERVSLRDALDGLLGRAAPLLDAADVQAVGERLDHDRALALATPDVFVQVYPDGWAPERLQVRWRQPATPVRLLRLHARHARPGGGPLTLEIQRPDSFGMERRVVADNGEFSVDLDVADAPADARMVFGIHCRDAFVPAELEAGSGDERALAFLVEGVEAIR